MEKNPFREWRSSIVPQIQVKTPLSHARILKREVVDLISGKESYPQSEVVNVQDATLQLEKQGDILKSIQVSCICGRQTTITLEYDKESVSEKDLIPNPKVH